MKLDIEVLSNDESAKKLEAYANKMGFTLNELFQVSTTLGMAKILHTFVREGREAVDELIRASDGYFAMSSRAAGEVYDD